MPTVFLRRRLLLAAPALLLANCASDPAPVPQAAAPAPEPPRPATPDARVEIIHWQAGFIGQAKWGRGVLIMDDQRRRAFRIHGAGIGGLGMARIRATGDVFNLPDPSAFPGIYGQIRAGAVMPGAEVTGLLWLQNPAGVRIGLRPQRTGLALQLGVDGVLIDFV